MSILEEAVVERAALLEQLATLRVRLGEMTLEEIREAIEEDANKAGRGH
jgi:hypothetical protein